MQTNGTHAAGHGINILDKVDRSLVFEHLGRPMSKVERYDWTTGGSVGKFKLINKTDLNIDGRYQRDQVSENKVLEIARKWDWLLIGTLSVIEREDGTYWVFDGGHRTRAAFYRDDITQLPCMVHSLESVNDEAKAFVARNTMVSNVAAFDRFHASVCAKEPVAIQASKILKELGLTVVKGGVQTGNFISCVGALQKCIEEDADDARKVLEFCIELAGDQIVTGRVLLAMFLLYRHFKDQFDVIDRYGDKLRRHSQRDIEVKMNQFARETGKSGNVIYAKCLVEMINYKMRNRLEW